MLKDLNADFQDLINCLTVQGVEFLVVGAHALAFHGIPRYRSDLDLWMKRSNENAHRLRAALESFGVPISAGEAHRMTEPRKFLRLCTEPRGIEILNFLDGCEYEVASARANHEKLGDSNVAIISLIDYVATKRASGHPKDQSDLVLLRSMIGELPGD